MHLASGSRFDFEEADAQVLEDLESVIPAYDLFEFARGQFKPEECLPILGVRRNGHFFAYTHVVRLSAPSNLQSFFRENGLPQGTDKLMFFNYDIHGKFYWQAVYSTALFVTDLDENLQIIV